MGNGPGWSSRSPPDFTDPATGGPLPGRGEEWNVISGYRVRLAWQARDWPTRHQSPKTVIALSRDRAAAALAAPSARLTPGQRIQIRNLAVNLHELAQILRQLPESLCPHPGR
jgi:hypothetical protein